MRIPKYRKHASGQARVVINGKDYYLGKHGTKLSRQRYDALIAEWLADNRSSTFGIEAAEITLRDLMIDFLGHAEGYYSESEYEYIKRSLRPLNKLYSDLTVTEFGPKQFKAVRQVMIEQQLARTNINASMKRIARMIKWGAAEGKYPAAIYDTLKLIPSLQRGRSEAKESEPVRPVCEDKVAATIEHCSPVVADMIRIQLLTGCRPGEVCMFTPKLIERIDSVWEAKLDKHKTAYRGKERIIMFGPEAQKILTPYLFRGEDEAIFQPCEAVRRLRESRERLTPVNCGNRVGYSDASRKGRKPKRPPGTRYTSKAYAKAITYACKKAFPEPDEATKEELAQWRAAEWWSPNQLRHTSATKIRKKFGLEVAAIILGHSKLETSQVYAERDREAAIAIVAKIG